MVYPLLFGSTLLRTQQSRLPQTFRRFKSITAAIERGRQGGPDRPSRPRTTRTPTEYGGSEGGKTRRELRFDRFGPAKDGGENEGVKERPRRDRDERVSSPRSSRFGRVGSPRSRDFPSRFQGDGEDKPSKSWEERPPRTREDRPSSDRPERSSRPWEETPPRENRFASPSDRTARFEGRDRPAPRGEDREPRRERFAHREERPQRREGQFDRGDRKPFDRGDRGSYNGGERKPFDRERKPFDRGDRKPFDRGDKKPFDHGDRKSFDRGDRKPFDGPRREAFGRGGFESRSEQPQGTFRRRDESSSYARERPGREQTERYQSQDSSRKQPEGAARTTETADAPRSSIRDVDSLPYTTAASEFIYGYSSVLAAMKANRRKLYNLYVHSRGASRDGLLARIRALKLFPITQEVGDEYLRAMDKASSGRPHNGVILESSALPVPPITELKPASFEDESFSVTLDSQTAEDALINGKQELYPYKAAGWRHPLILYVDGVLDEGNLGAIARSAYFLGVDAIITPTRQIAPWSHIALKASAGAAEAVPLFKVGEPSEFLGKSSRAGWRIYASDAIPPPSSTSPEVEDESSSNVIYTFARSTKRLPVGHCPVADHPTILMMGAEGAGLRDGLLNLAHYKVGIRHGREVDEIGVDSLNVSVAASLLCYEMLQKPKSKPAPTSEETLF